MACPTLFCPVKVLARQVARIMAHGIAHTTPWLSLVSPGVHIVAANISSFIHQAANDTNLIT
jgi:hypothetical protein